MSDWDKNTMDFDLNIDWSHITEHPDNKGKYKFISINNEGGAIQKRLARGWAVWDKEDLGYQSVWDNKSVAKRSKEDSMVARVPVGQGRYGPTEQILLYKPMDQWQREELAVHKKNADDAIGSVNASANKEKLQAVGGVNAASGSSDVGELNNLQTNIAPEPGSDVVQGNS